MSEFAQSVHLWLPGVVAMLGLILVSAFFSSSETALFYLSRDDLRAFRFGNPRQRVAAELLSNPDRLLTAILFWNLLVNLSYFAVSIVVAQRLSRHGQNAAAGVFAVMGLVTIIIFGEVLPKSSAVVLRHRLAAIVSFPLAAAVRVLDPIIPILGTVTRIAHRTFWPQIEREPFLEADDLERAVEASGMNAEVVRHEQQVLHNILDLSEIKAEEVMRPRGTCLALEPPIHRAALGNHLPLGDYVLVYKPGTEDVEAAIPTGSFAVIPERNLESAAEKVVHVPWCANLADTLELLRSQVRSVAAVVNEYGEDIGIVTYEDLVDTILIPQPSRARRLLQREPVLEIAPGRFHVEGLTTLRYLCMRLNIDYEPTDDGLVTVAGMLHDELEHLPVVGDECVWRDHRFRVIDVTERGHVRTMVSQLPPATPLPPPDEDS